MADLIIDECYDKISKKTFEPYGILDIENKIHTLGTDSKIIGRIFEMFTQPILSEIADSKGMILITPEKQNRYPDFVMMKEGKPKDKIAIDVKTTYVTGKNSSIKFTLGSYCSYMRNNTKNIEFEYTDYTKHYVIGFIYRRNGLAQESQIYDYSKRKQIPLPYDNVQYFIQEKYKISGEKKGSGNTENIGSFPTTKIEDLKQGNGPFSTLGVDIFNLYWKYYPRYRSTEKEYTSLDEFKEWVPKNIENLELLYPFDKDAVLKKLQRH